jgi:hypothetical protein
LLLGDFRRQPFTTSLPQVYIHLVDNLLEQGRDCSERRPFGRGLSTVRESGFGKACPVFPGSPPGALRTVSVADIDRALAFCCNRGLSGSRTGGVCARVNTRCSGCSAHEPVWCAASAQPSSRPRNSLDAPGCVRTCRVDPFDLPPVHRRGGSTGPARSGSAQRCLAMNSCKVQRIFPRMSP